MYTTVPAFTLTLIVFAAMGLGQTDNAAVHVHQYTEGLASTFHISLFTLLVPVLTAVLIMRRVPSLIVLFLSAMMAGIVALVLQPHILTQIAADPSLGTAAALTKGLVITYYGATSVDTGLAELNELVSTGGMIGMLNTIWLIICAMCFGAVMVASGMIESITRVVISWVHSRVGLVSSTVSTGLFLNITTGDQFISIVLTANMFQNVYEKQGYEPRLLSRTAEDSATVTSVLVPWNTCGLTQSTVLGVPTIAYLPYCFFNILSPLMTILVAAVGWRIKKTIKN
jgi:NhaC family Na+:H+ antiporter